MEFIPQGTYTPIDKQTKPVEMKAFWMSNEITVKEYMKFVDDVRTHPDDSLKLITYFHINNSSTPVKTTICYQYKELLPQLTDSALVNGQGFFADYFSNDKYNDYPMVGITYENARLYCAWLTKQENKKMKKEGLPFDFHYRLPTKEEWLYASTLKASSEKKENKNREMQKVKAGKENSFGLYCFNSNVSEWILLSTDAKPVKSLLKEIEGPRPSIGSSWLKQHPIGKVIHQNPHTRSQDLGFRIVKSYLLAK